MPKIIKTTKYKTAEATGDDQSPSVVPRHDSRGQGGLFYGHNSGIPDSEQDVKDKWERHKKKRRKPKTLPKVSI